MANSTNSAGKKPSAVKPSAVKPSARGKPSVKKGSRGDGTRSATRSAMIRRPPSGGLPLLRLRTRRFWRDLLERRSLWITLFVLVGTWALLPQRLLYVPSLEPGEVADRTWIADRDLQVENEEQTQNLRQQARERVLPIYDLDRSAEDERRGRLATLFAAGRQLLESLDPPPDPADPEALETLAARLVDAGGVAVQGSETLALLVREGFSTQLEDRLAGVLTRVLRQGVVNDKDLLLEHQARGITVQNLPSGTREKELDLFRFLDYPDQVREEIEADLRGWDRLRTADRRVLVDFVLANIAPNLTDNQSETLRARKAAADEIGTVSRSFARGEVIVRKGTRAGELEAQALAQLAGERDLFRLVLAMLGIVLLLGAVVLLVALAVRQARRPHGPRRTLGELLILLTLAIVGVRFGVFVSEALAAAIEREPFDVAASYLRGVPFAALALVTVLLYGRDLALVTSLVFSLLAGHLTGGDAQWETAVFSLSGCLAAVFVLDHLAFRQRSIMTRAALVVGGVNVAAAFVLQIVGGQVDGGAARLGFDLACGFAGGILAASLTAFVVPVAETVFEATTSIKLVELANPNLPLLRRLAFEAPGSFQHSLAVANLAKAGVEAIEGDSVLVHTGALYHDIGKIFRPHYFIENQPPGQNPHDKIQPSMSSLILINHVKEGLELAEQNALPAPILDAIEQHHGTRLIKFFYQRAKDQRDPETDEVSEEEFRYPGPKPQSKEMGVLMLADAVEAASRTLVSPSRQKIRSVLRAVFDDCLQDHQLDQTDLTLGDLEKVKEAFQRVLVNIHHRRIEYPGFDFNRDERAKKESPPAAPAEDPVANPSQIEAAGEGNLR